MPEMLLAISPQEGGPRSPSPHEGREALKTASSVIPGSTQTQNTRGTDPSSRSRKCPSAPSFPNSNPSPVASPWAPLRTRLKGDSFAALVQFWSVGPFKDGAVRLAVKGRSAPWRTHAGCAGGSLHCGGNDAGVRLVTPPPPTIPASTAAFLHRPSAARLWTGSLGDGGRAALSPRLRFVPDQIERRRHGVNGLHQEAGASPNGLCAAVWVNPARTDYDSELFKTADGVYPEPCDIRGRLTEPRHGSRTTASCLW